MSIGTLDADPVGATLVASQSKPTDATVKFNWAQSADRSRLMLQRAPQDSLAQALKLIRG